MREMSEGRGSMSAMNSLHHGGRTPTTSASAIEQLQSLIKQKEGELANAQVQLLAYVSSYSSLGTHFRLQLRPGIKTITRVHNNYLLFNAA